jgi:hypothetical protein
MSALCVLTSTYPHIPEKSPNGRENQPVSSLKPSYPLLQRVEFVPGLFGSLPFIFLSFFYQLPLQSPYLVGIESKLAEERVVRPVVEEAGCEACDHLSSGERVCWEVVFSQRESNTNYRTLRIPNLAYCREPEREVKQSMDCVTLKVYTPRWNRHVGNEIP